MKKTRRGFIGSVLAMTGAVAAAPLLGAKKPLDSQDRYVAKASDFDAEEFANLARSNEVSWRTNSEHSEQWLPQVHEGKVLLVLAGNYDQFKRFCLRSGVDFTPSMISDRSTRAYYMSDEYSFHGLDSNPEKTQSIRYGTWYNLDSKIIDAFNCFEEMQRARARDLEFRKSDPWKAMDEAYLKRTLEIMEENELEAPFDHLFHLFAEKKIT